MEYIEYIEEEYISKGINGANLKKLRDPELCEALRNVAKQSNIISYTSYS